MPNCQRRARKFSCKMDSWAASVLPAPPVGVAMAQRRWKSRSWPTRLREERLGAQAPTRSRARIHETICGPSRRASSPALGRRTSQSCQGRPWPCKPSGQWRVSVRISKRNRGVCVVTARQTGVANRAATVIRHVPRDCEHHLDSNGVETHLCHSLCSRTRYGYCDGVASRDIVTVRPPIRY